MEYYEVIHRRRIIRYFRDDPIEADAVDRIVTAERFIEMMDG